MKSAGDSPPAPYYPFGIRGAHNGGRSRQREFARAHVRGGGLFGQNSDRGTEKISKN